MKACHRRNELEKRRQYDERIRIVELGSFTALVFTTAGGMGQSATTFYKALIPVYLTIVTNLTRVFLTGSVVDYFS